MLLTRSALRRAGLLTLAIAAVVALAACSSSDASEPASSTDQGGGTATVTDGAVTITADNLAFDASVIQATAGEDFTITLVNNDSAPHNISIYTEEGGELIGSAGATAEGDQTVTIDVSALDAGTYYFQCDIHPDMNGSVEVSA
jgi:plastocyanin